MKLAMDRIMKINVMNTKARSLHTDMARDIENNTKLDSLKDNDKILTALKSAETAVAAAISSDFRRAVMVAHSAQALQKIFLRSRHRRSGQTGRAP